MNQYCWIISVGQLGLSVPHSPLGVEDRVRMQNVEFRIENSNS